MPRILVTAAYASSLLLRQTPAAGGHWEEYEFVFQPTKEPVDGWVVLDDFDSPLTQLCPPQNTLLITGEPESVRRYRSRYTGQFGQVWTSHDAIKHPFKTQQNEAQHWHYGMRPGAIHPQMLTLDDLAALPCPTKTHPLSVICSNKAVTPDHRRRLEFVKTLKSELGDAVDCFGRGTRDMEDKSEAILPYKYHIVLENDHSDFFMTEKISDAFLGWSYPLYFGGSEASNRFPAGSFSRIDIYQPESAIATIREVLQSRRYETAIDSLAEARRRVLYENNLFAMLATYCRKHFTPGKAVATKLHPKSHRTSLILNQVGRSLSKPFRQAA